MKILEPQQILFPSPLRRGVRGEVIFLLFFSFSSFGQQKLSLQDCMDYAEKHHPDIQNLRMAKESENVELQRIENQRLPSLNLSFNQGGNLGRTIDPFSNDVVTRAITFNSLGMSGGFTVYAGNRQKLQEAKQELAISLANYQLANAQLNKRLEIVRAFFTLLLDKMAIELKQQQLQEIDNQLLRIRELTKEGIVSPLQQHEQLALLANEQIQLQQLETSLATDKIGLETLIFWKDEKSIDIKEDFEVNNLPQKLSIEPIFLQKNPQVLAQNSQIKSIEIDKKLQLSSFKPTIQLSMNTSTSYSSAAPSEYTFFRQFNTNFGQYVGVGLSYPLFPRNQQKLLLEKNRLQFLQQTATKEKTIVELNQQLKRIATEYASILLQIEKMQTVSQQFKQIYEASLAKYNEGVITTIELNQWQNKYFESRFNLKKMILSAQLSKMLFEIYTEK